MKYFLLLFVATSVALGAPAKAPKVNSVVLKWEHAEKLPAEGLLMFFLPPPRKGLSKMSCAVPVNLGWKGPFQGIENQLNAMAAKMRLQYENKISQKVLETAANQGAGPEVIRRVSISADYFRVHEAKTAPLFLVRLTDFAGTFQHQPKVTGAAIPSGETAFVNETGLGLSFIDPGTTSAPLSLNVTLAPATEALKKSACGFLWNGSFEVNP